MIEKKLEMKGNIFLYYGEESFLLKERIKQLKKASMEKYGEFNVMNIIFESLEKGFKEYIDQKTKEIAGELITPSFFGEKRVIFLDNFPPSAKGNVSSEDLGKMYQRVINSLIDLPEENVVIISVEKPDKRLKIWKSLQALAKNQQEFALMEPYDLNKWILGRVASLGGKMLPAASAFLAEYCANDLWKLDQETQKLVNYCEDKPISEADIQKVCIMSAETADFALTNALQENNLKKAIKIFQTDLESAGSAQEVFYRDIAPAVRQLMKTVWAVKNNRTAKEIGVHPFVYQKWQKMAGRFSYDKIKKAYEALVLIDEGTKNGKIEILPNDLRMFSLVIEAYFLEFFGRDDLELKNPLLKKN